MAGVIRRETASASGSFSFDDLERRGRETIARAEEQARRIVADAKALAQEHAEVRRREAYEKGLAEGRVAGLLQIGEEARRAARDAACAEMTRLTEALGTGLAEFERQKRGLIASAESGLIELAVAIARRVCKIRVEGSADAARANARALLEMVRHGSDLELRVSSAEHELLRDIAADFVQNAAQLEHVAVVADPAVERGGCILRTTHGTIDASITGQLDRIAEAICVEGSGFGVQGSE